MANIQTNSIVNNKQVAKGSMIALTKVKRKENFLLNFVLGGLSGSIAKTFVAPTERIKLVLQTQTSQRSIIQNRYNGIGDCFRKVVKTEGFASLWKGNGVNVMKCFPMNAFSLALKDAFSKLIVVQNPKENQLKFLAASMAQGGLAGACTISIVYPLDFCRTRLSTDMVSGGKRQFNGLYDCGYKIVRNEGVRGLYRGISMALTGVCLSKAFILGTYDFLRQGILSDDKQISFWKKFLIANCVTQTTQIALYPLDTVGRALMMQSGLKRKLYKSPIDCARKLVRQNGVKALYKGCSSDMMSGIGASLILVLYNDLKKAINKSY